MRNRKLTKTEQTKLNQLRKAVDREKKRLKITEPKFTIGADPTTKKIRLNYSLPIDMGIDANNNRIVRKKQKQKYLKSVTLNDGDYLIQNVKRYADDILKETDSVFYSLGNDKDSIEYWVEIYTTSKFRKGNIEISQRSLESEAYTFRFLIKYLDEFERDMKNVWKWIGEGRKCVERFMKYKQTTPFVSESKFHRNKTPKVWSNGSVNSNYRRIRGFFNWLSTQLEGFPPNLLNGMPFTPTKTKKLTFTPTEMDKVKQFVKDEKDTKVWGWFIPMLMVMMETGVRIRELCNMRINDIEPSTRTWSFKGKGRYGGKERIQRLPQYLWDMISYLIVDEKGNLRTDKEYVFHQSFYKPYGVLKWGGKMIKVEDLNKRFTEDGFRNKFYKMVEHLKLTKGLSPHACRRYYITEMLKKTNGDIPLVAQLVGHSSWDMVKHYAQSMITEKTDTNIGLFSD